jgi:hypothetical protein
MQEATQLARSGHTAGSRLAFFAHRRHHARHGGGDEGADGGGTLRELAGKVLPG